MGEKEEKLMYFCTHACDDPEKASIPFVMANAALAMDIKTTVVLQGNAVYLAKKGCVDNILRGGGFPHISQLMKDFMELGGELKVCVPCIGERPGKHGDTGCGDTPGHNISGTRKLPRRPHPCIDKGK